jgi:hypothetical protein
MRPAIFRLVLCGALFAAWMAYLAFLVFTRPLLPASPVLPSPGHPSTPLVLSRPQILSSDLDVVARIDEKPADEPEVTVVEVLYAAPGITVKEGDTIRVKCLDECHAVQVQREGAPKPSLDWSGPGKYLLPLRALHEGHDKALDRFDVAPVPASPGFHENSLRRIYPATAEALAQYRRIVKDGKPPRE